MAPIEKPELGNNAVLVLGMHRSGTSATAGCLNRLGVYLGDNRDTASPYNPKGFYEHQAVTILHDWLLRVLGSSWDNPGPLPRGWENLRRVAPFRRRLRAILLRDFAETPLWAVKDPRMCRLLPLWLPLLAEMKVAVKALLVVRSPAEVAASIAARDAMPEKRVLALWLAHALSAERQTRGMDRAVILYEDLLADWRGELARVQDALDVTWPGMGTAAETEVDDFLEPELRHQKNARLHFAGPERRLCEASHAAFVAWRRYGADPAFALDRMTA